MRRFENIIIATDPDSDRLGVMCKNADGYRLLTGNEIGKIFTYFLIPVRFQKSYDWGMK
mgnify:CR=1 FL=1